MMALMCDLTVPTTMPSCRAMASIELAAAPDDVWSLIGQFGGAWHPGIARIRLNGDGVGQLSTIASLDGKEVVERLDAIDNAKRFLRYTNIAGIAAARYTGMLEEKPKGSGCIADWRAQFLANDQPDIVVKGIVLTWVKSRLESLRPRFGVAK